LILRENTECPITVSQGTNLLVGAHPAKIVLAAIEILGGRVRPNLSYLPPAASSSRPLNDAYVGPGAYPSSGMATPQSALLTFPGGKYPDPEAM